MDENKEPREMLENIPEDSNISSLGSSADSLVNNPVDNSVNNFGTSDMPLENEALEDNILYSWSEVDYIKKTRSPIWYILFVLVIIALSVVSVVFMKSWSFVAVLVMVMVVVLVLAYKPERYANYAISTNAIHVNDSLFPISELKSYSIKDENGLYAVTFHSKKRFKLGTTVYCSNSDMEPVKQSLNDLLPQVKSELDLLDKIARFLSL